MCVRGLLPPGRALPAPALRACGRPGPVTSRLRPRPEPACKGRRSRAPARQGGREGTRRARRQLRPFLGETPASGWVSVCGDPRSLRGRCFLLLFPSSPHGPRRSQTKSACEAGRGPGASGAHTPATLTWAGARRPWPRGRGTYPIRVSSGTSRMRHVLRASCLIDLAWDAGKANFIYIFHPSRFSGWKDQNMEDVPRLASWSSGC